MQKKPTKSPPSMLTLLNRVYRKQLETQEAVAALAQTQADAISRLKKLAVGMQKLESLAVDNAAQQHTIAALTACLDHSQRKKHRTPSCAPSQEWTSPESICPDKEMGKKLYDWLEKSALKSLVYDYVGAKGDIGHSPPVWCQQHLSYCTDVETANHKFYAAGPKSVQMDAICQSMSMASAPLPANGHDWPLRRRPGHELCALAATHVVAVACQACEWRG